MRNLIIAGFFLLIVASDWTWSETVSPAKSNFVPKSFSAEFVQEFKSLLSKKVKKSKGKVDYQFPSNIRFEMKGKSELTFVSNTKKSWYFTPSKEKGEPSQLRIGKASDNNLAQFFDLLKNGLKTNKDYKVEKIKDEYTITFDKKVAKKIDLKKATLIFKKKSHNFKDLKEIHLVRKKNKKVKMIFSEMNIGKKFADSHFIFVAPKNTRKAN